MDRPSKEVTSHSSDMAENFSHIPSILQTMEDLARIRPLLRLPDPPEDYEILPCSSSDRLTKDPGGGVFTCLRPFLPE